MKQFYGFRKSSRCFHHRFADSNKCKILLSNINWHQELSNMKAHDQKERLIKLLTENMKEAGATISSPRGKAKPPRPLKSN